MENNLQISLINECVKPLLDSFTFIEILKEAQSIIKK